MLRQLIPNETAQQLGGRERDFALSKFG